MSNADEGLSRKCRTSGGERYTNEHKNEHDSRGQALIHFGIAWRGKDLVLQL